MEDYQKLVAQGI